VSAALRIGVISDSHEVVPQRVREVFAGVDHILHAGDLEGLQVLAELELIAPVTAVRGNCDGNGALARLPHVANTVLGGARFIVAHKEHVALSALQAEKSPVAAVVTGHTHTAVVERRNGVLFINPGSTTYDYGSGLSVAIVTVDGGAVSAQIVALGEGDGEAASGSAPEVRATE
jgi:putative phosphoesterase